MSIGRHHRHVVFALSLCSVFTALAPDARAEAIGAIDQLIITRGGAPNDVSSTLGSYRGQPIFYRDLFDNGNAPPAGGTFNGGVASAGVYNVVGSYGIESGGVLALSSALGGATQNAINQDRVTQIASLSVNVDPANAFQGLKQAFHDFSVYGLFRIGSLATPTDSIALRLSDVALGQPIAQSVEVQVRNLGATGLGIRLLQQDFLLDTVAIFDVDAYAPPAGATAIELLLQRASSTSDAITGGYRFWSGSAPLTDVFTMLTGSPDGYLTRGFLVPAFYASQAVVIAAVPEPSMLGIAVLLCLAFAARRRRPT
jgi:hypothetical protein